jgi:hypothetical protein
MTDYSGRALLRQIVRDTELQDTPAILAKHNRTDRTDPGLRVTDGVGDAYDNVSYE